MKRITLSDYGTHKIPPPAGTKYVDRPSYMDVYQRLAAIEDILGDEYELDRLRELVEAEKEDRYIIMKEPRRAGVHRLTELAEADREGRCVVLPCKLGDAIYFITGIYNSLVKPAKVEEIYIGDGSIALGVSTDFTTFTLQESEWYLTRAEAVAALKAREQDE